MAQKMTEENKPFVMATLSEVAYKNLEEASKTFEHFRFTEYKFIDRDGAQCYLIWNDDDAVGDIQRDRTETMVRCESRSQRIQEKRSI